MLVWCIGESMVSIIKIKNGVSDITLLNDVGPQNITVGCWELNLNLSLLAQVFKHPVVI